jgi:hypothetical protein
MREDPTSLLSGRQECEANSPGARPLPDDGEESHRVGRGGDVCASEATRGTSPGAVQRPDRRDPDRE